MSQNQAIFFLCLLILTAEIQGFSQSRRMYSYPSRPRFFFGGENGPSNGFPLIIGQDGSRATINAPGSDPTVVLSLSGLPITLNCEQDAYQFCEQSENKGKQFYTCRASINCTGTAPIVNYCEKGECASKETGECGPCEGDCEGKN